MVTLTQSAGTKQGQAQGLPLRGSDVPNDRLEVIVPCNDKSGVSKFNIVGYNNKSGVSKFNIVGCNNKSGVSKFNIVGCNNKSGVSKFNIVGYNGSFFHLESPIV